MGKYFPILALCQCLLSGQERKPDLPELILNGHNHQPYTETRLYPPGETDGERGGVDRWRKRDQGKPPGGGGLCGET